MWQCSFIFTAAVIRTATIKVAPSDTALTRLPESSHRTGGCWDAGGLALSLAD
jgi:hypothetical protein